MANSQVERVEGVVKEVSPRSPGARAKIVDGARGAVSTARLLV